jgi:hypothetical protein
MAGWSAPPERSVERDEALAAKGKDKNQVHIGKNMEWQKLTFRFFKPI